MNQSKETTILEKGSKVIKYIACILITDMMHIFCVSYQQILKISLPEHNYLSLISLNEFGTGPCQYLHGDTNSKKNIK